MWARWRTRLAPDELRLLLELRTRRPRFFLVPRPGA